ACRAVGAARGITVASPRLDQAADPLRLIARASGFRTRRIRLGAGWGSEGGEPMLGRLADDGRPVGPIPRGAGRDMLVDPARDVRVPVDGELARALQPTAVVFYRTLPPGPVTLCGLVRFALPSIRGELWTLAGMGLICGLLGLVAPIVTAVAIDDAI